MRKQVKLLIFSSLIFAFLGGFLSFLIYFRPKEKVSDVSFANKTTNISNEKLINKNFKNLECITLKNRGDSFTVNLEKNEKGEDVYHLIKADCSKVSQDLIEKSIMKNFINEIEEMTSLKLVSEGSDDFPKYGLENKNIAITLNFKGSDSVVLFLGNEAPFSSGYYLSGSSPELNNIYLISEIAAEVFFLNVESFMTEAKVA